MTHHVVTGRDLETHTVTLDVPHGDLLARAAAALSRWRAEAGQAETEMARLRDAGVLLDQEGNPVTPTFWDRREENRGWWLVWPADYARETGRPRRARVDDVEAVTEKRRRTIAYRDAWERHGRLLRQIEQAGQDLTRLAAKYDW